METPSFAASRARRRTSASLRSTSARPIDSHKQQRPLLHTKNRIVFGNSAAKRIKTIGNSAGISTAIGSADFTREADFTFEKDFTRRKPDFICISTVTRHRRASFGEAEHHLPQASITRKAHIISRRAFHLIRLRAAPPQPPSPRRGRLLETASFAARHSLCRTSASLRSTSARLLGSHKQQRLLLRTNNVNSKKIMRYSAGISSAIGFADFTREADFTFEKDFTRR